MNGSGTKTVVRAKPAIREAMRAHALREGEQHDVGVPHPAARHEAEALIERPRHRVSILYRQRDAAQSLRAGARNQRFKQRPR